MIRTTNTNLLYAWELGGNTGHVNNFLAVQAALTASGFNAYAAIQPLPEAIQLLKMERVHVFAAPRAQITPVKPPLSFAHILVNQGFSEPVLLLSLVSTWRSILMTLKPDIVLADAAPVALLAAETLGIRTIFFAPPFFLPPITAVFDDFEIDHPSPVTERQAYCQQIVESVNQVRIHFGLTPIQYAAEIFRASDNGLLIFKETDPYAPRKSVCYHGPLWRETGGEPFSWPQGAGLRTFVYLRPSQQPRAMPVLSLLRQLGWPVVAYCPDISESHCAQLRTDNFFISQQPLAMQQILTDAQLSINYGSLGIANALLTHGIAQLFLPIFSEHRMTAKAIADMGAGTIMTQASMAQWQQALAHVAADTVGYRQAAQQFKMQHHDFNTTAVVNNLVQRCLHSSI